MGKWGEGTPWSRFLSFAIAFHCGVFFLDFILLAILDEGVTMNFDAFIECVFDSVSIESLAEGQNVHIRILDHEKNRWILTATAVNAFSLNDMCLQNIIDHISLYDMSNVDSDIEGIQRKIFFLLQGRFPVAEDELILKESIERIFKDIRESRSLLLEIEPVCGAEVLLLAKHVFLHCETQ